MCQGPSQLCHPAQFRLGQLHCSHRPLRTRWRSTRSGSGRTRQHTEIAVAAHSHTLAYLIVQPALTNTVYVVVLDFCICDHDPSISPVSRYAMRHVFLHDTTLEITLGAFARNDTAPIAISHMAIIKLQLAPMTRNINARTATTHNGQA